METNKVGKRCVKITPVIDNVKKQNITRYVLEARFLIGLAFRKREKSMSKAARTRFIFVPVMKKIIRLASYILRKPGRLLSNLP